MFKKLTVLFLLVLAPLFLSATTYTIKNVIKTNGYVPVKINNNGFVAGYTLDCGQPSVAFIYDSKNEELVLLKAFDSDCTCTLDLNNKNEVIGYYCEEVFSPLYGKQTQSVPFIWSKEKGFISLRSTLGYICNNYDSLKINDLGWVAGYGFVDSIFDFNTHKGKFKPNYSSLIWSGKQNALIFNHPTAPDNFGVSIKSLNNNGDATGGMFYSTGQHSDIWQPAYAFLWDSTQRKTLPLGNLGGQDKFYSCATDINDSKQVVGLSEVNMKKHGRYCYHAFLWNKGAMFDLGVLDQNQESIARAINSQGDVVGKSSGFDGPDYINKAFIWSRQGGMVDLNSQLDSDLNCKLIEAFDINDDGQIVCLSMIDGEWHIVLLTPSF